MHRLSMTRCPACDGENPPQARFCLACGTPLVMRCPACDAINARTRAQCHHCQVPLGTAPTAPGAASSEATVPAGLDDGPAAPVSVSGPHLDTPATDWLSFRIDVLEQAAAGRLPDDAGSAPAASGTDATARHGTLIGTVIGASVDSTVDTPVARPADDAMPAIDPRLLGPEAAHAGQPWVRPAAPPIPPIPPTPPTPLVPPGPPTPTADERRHDRAERRAAVRRSQLRRHSVPDAPTLRDVLVLEPDTDTRIDLCALLETFGFRPHVAVTVAEAEGLSLRQRHIAAFLGAGEDIDATAAFCRRLHDAVRGRPSALIAVGGREQHADRVQWQLAGADQLIFRPVTRGGLARALTDAGLGLPDDPRHGARPRS